jgi:alkylhydroperoxidase family enzyme
MTPRVPPVPFRDWPVELSGALPSINRPGAPVEEQTQKAQSLLGTLAHHPELVRACLPLNAHLLRATSLTERQRELLVLRVAVLRKSAYVWAEHTPMAHRAGLDGEEIAGVAFGPDAPCWTSLDTALLRSVDELVEDGKISNQTWSVLAESLDVRQLIDLIYTVGAYQTTTFLVGSFALDPDDERVPNDPADQHDELRP